MRASLTSLTLMLENLMQHLCIQALHPTIDLFDRILMTVERSTLITQL